MGGCSRSVFPITSYGFRVFSSDSKLFGVRRWLLSGCKARKRPKPQAIAVMQHHEVPPNLHLEKLNPHIDLDDAWFKAFEHLK